MILSFFDIILPPFYIFFIIVYCNYIRHKRERLDPAYKYYTMGMSAKIVGAVAFCLVYTLYYESGDTTGYFDEARVIHNLFFKSPSQYFEILFSRCTPENYSYFDNSTGYMDYRTWMGDKSAILLCKIISPLYFFSFNSFIVTTILFAWVCYGGVWKLYLLFCEKFPAIRDQLAISVLFIPSVVFWGSGLLKDTITLSCVGWFTYGFYFLLIKRKFRLRYIFPTVLSMAVIIGLKPYVMFALLPGSFLWLSYEWISSIKITIVKFAIAPLLIIGGLSAGLYLLTSLSDELGVYSLDNVLERAVVVNDDLKNASHYGGNVADIGTIDPSLGGVLSKAHLAINLALFRPYIWEVRNPMMLLSALESTYIMLLTLFLLFRLKFFSFFVLIWQNPLLLFSILFSLFFAFAVGLSTPLFGALVRLKIPCIPFFVSSLFVLRYLYEQRKHGRARN